MAGDVRYTRVHDGSRIDTPMIPLRDDLPTKRFPFVTVTLLLANIAAFAYALSLSDQELMALFESWAFTPANLLAEPASPAVLATLFSAMFLHGGWLHIGGNMLYLWIFGNNVEDRFGHLVFLGFYLATGVAATIAHLAAEGASEIPLVGASGAIAGVLGAYLVLYPRTRITVAIPIFFIIELARVPAAFVIGFWFLMQVVQGVGSISPEAAGGGVAWWAHVGGFVAGLAATAPVWAAEQYRKRARRKRRSSERR